MYLDRVYRLQVEFCEVTALLAHSPNLEARDQLTRRRMEIVAEASELVYTVDDGIPARKEPARPSPFFAAVGSASK